MRFKGPMMEAIRDGRKTVTRRLVVPGKPCLYQVGRVYIATDRPRFKATAKVGWDSIPIRIVSVRRENLSDIYRSEDEAVREGFLPWIGLSPRDQFLIAWGSIHGWPTEDPEVWRIEFTRAPPGWKRGG